MPDNDATLSFEGKCENGAARKSCSPIAIYAMTYYATGSIVKKK